MKATMAARWTQFETWVQAHKTEFVALLVILLTGAGLRLYRIAEYMTFLGDEGRDARVVMKLLTEFDPILIGPMMSVTTAAGHMHIGPAYYYMMAPAMALSGLSPVGPAVMIALLSVVTVGFVWWVGREWFAPLVGLIGALTYAISPTIITYSRSSWNPNIMPFFALLSVYAIFNVWQRRHPAWIVVAAFGCSMIMQSHMLGLLLFPAIGFIWLVSLIQQWKIATIRTRFLAWSAAAFGLFLIMFSPLVVFDMRHDYMNFNAVKAFFTVRQTTVNLRVDRGGERLVPLAEQVYQSVLTNDNKLLLGAYALTMIVTLMLGIATRSQAVRNRGLWILLLWLGTAIVGLSLYKQHIYAHYFEFVFPVIHLLFGWLLWQLWSTGQIWDMCLSCAPIRRLYAGLLLFGVIWMSILVTPLQWGPNRQYQKTTQIAEDVIRYSEGKPFNFGMMAKSNYDESYLFPMELRDAAVVAINPLDPTTITDQLFVVCENPDLPDSPEDEKCNPIGHPQTQIAAFGWAEIEQTWEYDWGYKLYKLVHVDLDQSDEASDSAETNEVLK